MLNKIRIKIYQLLRKSEKYTKTDMIYLAKGSFWLTLGQVISSFSSFLLAIAFANLLPKETYGTYKYILSLIGILAIPTLGGLNTSLIRSVAKGYEGTLIPALKVKIKWGFWGSAGSLILAFYYYLNGNNDLIFPFLLIAIFLPFLEAPTLYTAYLQGKKMFDIYSRYSILIKISVAIFLTAILFLTNNLIFIIFSYLFSWTFFRFIIFKKILIKFPPNKNYDQEAIPYGKKLTLISVIGIISNNIDKILTFHFLGPAELAIYAFAIALPENIKAVLRNIGALALPKFSENQNRKTLKKKIKSYFFKSMIPIGLIIFLYIILAPLFFKIFFPEYPESIKYSQIFSLSLIAFPTLLFTAFFNSQAKSREIFKIDLVYSAVKIILLFILLPVWGIYGVISATIFSRLTNLFYSYLLFKKVKL